MVGTDRRSLRESSARSAIAPYHLRNFVLRINSSPRRNDETSVTRVLFVDGRARSAGRAARRR
jgi:hypothetical protein